MPKVRMTLSIGFANARREQVIEVDDTDFEACETDEERDNLLEEYWKDWSSDYICGGFQIIKDSD